MKQHKNNYKTTLNKYTTSLNKHTTKQISTPPPPEKNAIGAYGKSLTPYGKSLNTPPEKKMLNKLNE